MPAPGYNSVPSTKKPRTVSKGEWNDRTRGSQARWGETALTKSRLQLATCRVHAGRGQETDCRLSGRGRFLGRSPHAPDSVLNIEAPSGSIHRIRLHRLGNLIQKLLERNLLVQQVHVRGSTSKIQLPLSV